MVENHAAESSSLSDSTNNAILGEIVMDVELLQQKFGRLGTRLQITEVAGRSGRGAGIDIRADTRGEYFDIRIEPNDPVDYEVVDLRPEMQYHRIVKAKPQANRWNWTTMQRRRVCVRPCVTPRP
jgi:hypothetical protein